MAQCILEFIKVLYNVILSVILSSINISYHGLILILQLYIYWHTVTSEVHLIQVQLKQSENANATIRSEKSITDQKAGKLV